MSESEIGAPDLVRVQLTPDAAWLPVEGSGAAVTCTPEGRGLAVDVAAPAGVARVALRWQGWPVPRGARTLVLGDAWERGYGELEWRAVRGERPLPWLFLAHDPDSGETWGRGVEVRGGAFACWTLDDDGVTLWLDLRNGQASVQPGERVIHAAVVRALTTTDRPWQAHGELTGLLCRDPLLPDGPLVGANNWYYAYGRDFDEAAVLRDARTIAELAGDHPVRPFGVIDDGWTLHGTADGFAGSSGPWTDLRRPQFGDMAATAAAMRATGVRPGIWYRPLLVQELPTGVPGTVRSGAWALDASHPGALQQVASDVARIAEWGYDLLKHDFSTFDLFGRWGSAMGANVADARPGASLAVTSRTNAEVLVELYRTIREAAGESMMVLGCNVVGHLAAGLTHAQRIGDDTSGREWERTRRVGVNTLAFRLAQHGRFFAADADCVPSTPQTDWTLNRQFLDLVARSGTALFVSVDPATRNAQVDADLAAAVKLALDGGEPGGIEPVDWLDNPTPRRWRTAAGEVVCDWYGELGGDPLEWGDHNR